MTVLLDRQASRGTVDGGRLRATTTTEVGSPDFFPASNHYLQFPLDLQNFCMKIVWIFCYLMPFLFPLVGESLFHGCGNLCFVDFEFLFWLHFLVHGCASFCFQRL